MRAVIAYRDELVALSETFVRSQIQALARYRGIYFGTRRASPSLGLPADRTAPIPSPMEGALFKLFHRVPGSWRPVLEAERPALVHAHFGPDGIWAATLSEQLGIPLVVTFYGFDATMRPLSSPLYAVYSLLRRRLFHRADRIIVIADFLERKLLEAGCPAEKITLLTTGVDVQSLLAQPNRPEGRTVLFTGRLVEKKGCEYLIRAMARVQEEIPEAKLVIAGDGPLRARLQSVARERGVHAEFLGMISQQAVADLMRKSWVLCLPSVTARSGDSEGLPFVILEAQSVGLPVISTRHAGIPEAVVDGETGILVNERDLEALTNALLTLLEDQSLRARFSAAAPRWIEANFDLRKQTAKLESLYDELAT